MLQFHCNVSNKDHAISIVLKQISERTLRKCITTQIEIQMLGWPEDTFCLWIPETVFADFDDKLWANWNPSQSQQTFAQFERNGFDWKYEDERCRIRAEITTDKASVDLACSVMNKTDEIMKNVSVQNCLHFPKAPRFSGNRGDNVYFCCDGKWIPMSSTQHWFDHEEKSLNNTTKFCFRATTLQQGRYHSIRNSRNADPERSEHSLIVKESGDRTRAVGIAGENWDFVFHNTNPKLGCIHSQPLPVMLRPHESVTFKQRIYFCNGNHKAVVEAFKQDILAKGSETWGSN